MVVKALIEDQPGQTTTDSCIVDIAISEARVAAAYAQLALLDNLRRVARIRERRQRIESRINPIYQVHSFCPGRMLPLAESYDCDHSYRGNTLVKLRYDPLPLSTNVVSLTSSQIVDMQSEVNLKHDDSSKLMARISFMASATSHAHRRACRAITQVHDQLLSERASRRRIRNAALTAGIRAADSAKQLARSAQASAANERLLTRYDALREAREHSFRV